MKTVYLKELDLMIDHAEEILESEINPDTGAQLTNEEVLEVERELERLYRMKNNPL